MPESEILHITSQALLVSAKLAAPIVLVSLAIGVLVSLFQAVTQIQEMTLSFVPKLVGVAVVLVLTGSWMLHEMNQFTREMFEAIPRLLGTA